MKDRNEFHGIHHIFEDLSPDAEYFAEIESRLFTGFHTVDYFSPDWAYSFQGGRYVIFICERHSIYKNGERIYQNNRFEGRSGDIFRREPRSYSILLGGDHGVIDKKTENSGSEYYQWHGMWIYRQTIRFDLNEAVDTAKELSVPDRFTAVVRYVNEYDMY
ncbi:MAG: hypothetical protein J5879_08815 [Clostridia bacterium]|nr:hypothetical protein [Clostridia bacterium]